MKKQIGYAKINQLENTREMPDENEGREPYLGREPQPQYKREIESYEGANAWGESAYSNDKPKRSNRDLFRDYDPAHSE